MLLRFLKSGVNTNHTAVELYSRVYSWAASATFPSLLRIIIGDEHTLENEESYILEMCRQRSPPADVVRLWHCEYDPFL